MIVIKYLAVFLGLCIYATFEHCDPIQAGVVSKSDEVLNFVGFFYSENF